MIDFNNEIYYKLSYVGMSLSEQTQESLNNYLFRGFMPGGHLEAQMAHDLERALYNADVANRKSYWAMAKWIRDSAPEGSHGSYDTVQAWCDNVDERRTKWATWYALTHKEEPEEPLF